MLLLFFVELIVITLSVACHLSLSSFAFILFNSLRFNLNINFKKWFDEIKFVFHENRVPMKVIAISLMISPSV